MVRFKEGQKVRRANTLQHGTIINNECNGWYTVEFNDGIRHLLPLDEIKEPLFAILKRLDSKCDSIVIRYIKMRLSLLKPIINLVILVCLFWSIVMLIAAIRLSIINFSI